MESRRRQTTIEQLHSLVDFMKRNKELALGRIRSKEARALSARLWSECSVMLNAEGPGRTPKEWAKVWNDLKCRVRAKVVANNASHLRTGGGPHSQAHVLSPIEEQVASVLGRDVGPLPHVRQDPFATMHDQRTYDSEEMLLPVLLAEYVTQDSEHGSAGPLSTSVLLESTAPQSVAPQHAALSGVAPQHAALSGVAPQHAALSGAARSGEGEESAAPEHAAPETPGYLCSPRSTGTSRLLRGRAQRQHRNSRSIRQAATSQAQSELEESRQMMLQIEKAKAEASLLMAQGFKLLAESVDRFTTEYIRQAEASRREVE